MWHKWNHLSSRQGTPLGTTSQIPTVPSALHQLIIWDLARHTCLANFVVSFEKQLATFEATSVEYNITQGLTDRGKFLVSYVTTIAGHYSISVSLDGRLGDPCPAQE